MAVYKDQPMIYPFVEKQNGNGVISYGVSSYGYDARVGNKFKIFTNLKSIIVNPKKIDTDVFSEHEGDVCIIPPNSYALANTIERFIIPRDVMAICLGKSTYARSGIIVNVTPLEPEWRGEVTIEISNASSSPVMIFANEGICQFIFLKADNGTMPSNDICDISYADRAGKYQNQRGITLPRVMP